jgi:drug/metabolite transporter (DMT)-like permease
MSFDLFICIAYALCCIAASYVLVGVKKGILWPWSSIFTSMISMFIWSLATRKTSLSLVQISALFDVVGAVAYFVGFALMGETITLIQWIGIFLLIFSLHLINR